MNCFLYFWLDVRLTVISRVLCSGPVAYKESTFKSNLRERVKMNNLWANEFLHAVKNDLCIIL